MIHNKKLAVVLPAYNAEDTVIKTIREIPEDIVDIILLVDDASNDRTVAMAEEAGIKEIIRHTVNKGYGANQKTCYNKILKTDADIVIMLHPDYQYTPKLITAISSIISQGLYPVVFGSRILGKGALKGGMPPIKYIANRLLTLIQNILLHQKLSEYHTGYRGFSREVLETIPYNQFSDNFVFDNQMVAEIFHQGFDIGEITCPTKYFKEASSIDLKNSTAYGLGVIGISVKYFFKRLL